MKWAREAMRARKHDKHEEDIRKFVKQVSLARTRADVFIFEYGVWWLYTKTKVLARRNGKTSRVGEA